LQRSFSRIYRVPSLDPNKVPYNVIISASIVPPTYRFSAFIAVNHIPDTAFATWIFLHGSFEEKN
jgi:hypothetical protein